MNEQEINIAIAEACGWTDLGIRSSDLEFNALHGTPPGTTHAKGLWLVQDFCNDLNAMHEAEKVLQNQFTTQEEAYWRNLSHVEPHPIYATARQRAEAFLRTIGKWK